MPPDPTGSIFRSPTSGGAASGSSTGGEIPGGNDLFGPCIFDVLGVALQHRRIFKLRAHLIRIVRLGGAVIATSREAVVNCVAAKRPNRINSSM